MKLFQLLESKSPEALTLDAAEFLSTVTFSSCLFPEKLQAYGLRCKHLFIDNCTFLSDIDLINCRMAGSLYLINIEVHGHIRLNGAQVNGAVKFDRVVMLNHGTAVDMTNASITDNLIFTGDCWSMGALDLQAIQVDGFVSLKGTDLRKPNGSLLLDGSRIRSNLSLRDLRCAGEFRLQGANIGHWMFLGGAYFMRKPVSVVIDMTRVGGHVLAKEGLTCAGTAIMRNSEVCGSVTFTGAKFLDEEVSLNLEGTHVHGSLTLGGHSECVSEFHMQGARVDHSVYFYGSRFAGSGTAISMPLTKVGHYVYFYKGFECTGTINMVDCELGGIQIEDAQLPNVKATVHLSRSLIHGPVALDEGLECAGEISLFSATVKGQIRQVKSFVGSLDLQAVVAPDFVRRDILRSRDSSLSLMFARIGTLRESKEAWPQEGKLKLRGFTADEIIPLSAERLGWLEKQPDEDRQEPQPWIHISKHLHDRGHYAASKHVIFHMRRNQALARRDKRRFGQLRLLFDLAVAKVEERPQRIILSLLVCVLVGTAIIRPFRGYYSETNDSAYQATHAPHAGGHTAVAAYPRFVPFAYALDNALPIIHLGQDDKWAPDSRASSPRIYWTLVATRWFLIATGWAQGIVLAAALDARFRTQ